MIDADVLVIGENRVFCDIVFTGLPKLPKLGEEIFAKNLDIKAGGAFFTPAGLARLGMKSILSTVLGDDALSQSVFKRIKDEGIDTSFVRLRRIKRGAVVPTTVSLSFADRALVSYKPPLQKYDSNLHKKVKVKHVHLPGYGTADPVDLLRNFKKLDVTVSIDACYQPDITVRSKIFKNLANLCDIFFCNKDEALLLTGKKSYPEALKELQKYIPEVVIKLGKDGAVHLGKSGLIKSKGFKAKVVDTTGAGELFISGYLYGYLNGCSVADCLKSANYCGARATEGTGMGKFPRIDELKKALSLFEKGG